MLFIVIILLIFLAYIVFIQNPESKRLNDKQAELTKVELQKKQIDQTIYAGEGLNTEIEAYKTQISEIEQRLLPEINTQIVAQKIQDKFIAHGIPFITLTNSEPVVEDRVLMPDGINPSPNFMKSVRINVQVCGTDGENKSILDAEDERPEEGYKVVGYDEFMKAVKDIEDDLPESVKIKSIVLKDSMQGFMYYTISVVVYAYDLPDRISEPNMDSDYLTWDGVPIKDIPTDGTIGVPYDLIPEPNRDEFVFRPFAEAPKVEEIEEPAV